jgi:flagellar assembly protein FliH
LSNASLTTGRRARVLRGQAADSHALQTLEPARSPGEARREAEEGYTAGFAAGYQDGMNEAVAAVESEAKELRGRLDRAFRAMSTAAAELGARQATDMAAIEDTVAAAALQLAEAIIGRELEVAKHPGADAIARALAFAPPAQAAVAHLHPEDLCDLDPELVARGRDLTIVPDPGVEPGGCILAVGDSRIDAQIGPALARVRDALFPEQP